MMADDIYLSVILPCRNQADHIGDVLRRYFPPLDATRRSYELVVVPNACTDATAVIVAAVARHDDRVKVVDIPEGGWGLSVLTGLRAARGAHVCYTNSARTDPADIVTLLKQYEQRQPSLAKVRREHRGMMSRAVGSWLYNTEARLLYGVKPRDINGTPKIFSRELFQRLDLSSRGDLLDLELMAKVTKLKIPVVELPVHGFRRYGGKSSTKLSSAWKMYTQAFGLRSTINALRDR